MALASVFLESSLNNDAALLENHLYSLCTGRDEEAMMPENRHFSK